MPEERFARPAVEIPLLEAQFTGDPSIVGQATALNSTPVTVAGVLPSTFHFGSVFAPGTKMDIFVPAIMDAMRNWGNTLLLIGRLKPGVSVAQTQAEAQPPVSALLLQPAHPEWAHRTKRRSSR